MVMKRRTYCFVILFLIFLFSINYSAMAQASASSVSQPSGTYLKLTLLDSLAKTPLEYASVVASYVGGTSKKYGMSDESGVVTIQNMGVGRATVTVEYMGYKPKSWTVDVKRGANDMGTLYLQEDINMLEAATVIGIANQMTVKKDTIEYTAASVKVNDSDVLEELLKKLPGIEIDTEGNITANGETVNKIMIDGKTFFLDDPQLATKNIPAKIVDKVRVVERKSDQARFTGIDDGEEETVIDLSVKKGMMNGWFGNLTGGYGTKERYQAGGMIGKFTENSQISLIGNANNTNNRGFMDIAGSMMGNLRVGRIRFGGGGILESYMGGVNANTTLKDDRLELSGNYLYSGSENTVEERRNRETILGGGSSSLYNSETTRDVTNTDGHRVGLEMEYNITENTSIIFRPTFDFTGGSFSNVNEFSTMTGDQNTNSGLSESWGNNDAERFRGMFLLRQRLGKPGRTLSLRLDYNISNNELDGYNYSETDYFEDNVESGSEIVDQFYTQNEKSYTLGGRFSYTEPLGKNFFVEGAYRYSYRNTDSDKDTYNKGAGGEYDSIDEEYSSHYENTFITQQAELNFMKQEQKYNITLGVSMQPSTTKSMGLARDTSYSVLNFAPSARIDYRFSDQKFLRIRYRGRTSQPSINQLMPIPDNSDPLKITMGNMDLNPEFSHNLRAEYRVSNPKNYSWFSAMLNGSYTTDKIVNRSWYDENGVQYTQPYNDGTGVYSLTGRILFNSKIAKSKFSIMNFTNIRFGNGISYVSAGEEVALEDSYVKNINKTFSVSENLGFTYRDDMFEFRLFGTMRYNNTWYSIQSMSGVDTWTNSVSGSVNASLPAGFNITSDISHTFYIGYSDGYGESSTVWNAELSKNMFKDKLTLKAKIYDILKDSQNSSRTTTDNYIEDLENNTLGQYMMFSVVWRFGNFGGGKMMGSHPGGGRPGPPPPRR